MTETNSPADSPAKSTSIKRSRSELVQDALRATLREDEADIAAFAERAVEKPITFEALLAKLKAN